MMHIPRPAEGSTAYPPAASVAARAAELLAAITVVGLGSSSWRAGSLPAAASCRGAGGSGLLLAASRIPRRPSGRTGLGSGRLSRLSAARRALIAAIRHLAEQ